MPTRGGSTSAATFLACTMTVAAYGSGRNGADGPGAVRTAGIVGNDAGVWCHVQRSETLDILLATVIDHWIRRAVPPGSNPDQVYRTLLRDERARRALAQVRAVRNGSQAAAP